MFVCVRERFYSICSHILFLTKFMDKEQKLEKRTKTLFCSFVKIIFRKIVTNTLNSASIRLVWIWKPDLFQDLKWRETSQKNAHNHPLANMHLLSTCEAVFLGTCLKVCNVNNRSLYVCSQTTEWNRECWSVWNNENVARIGWIFMSMGERQMFVIVRLSGHSELPVVMNIMNYRIIFLKNNCCIAISRDTPVIVISKHFVTILVVRWHLSVFSNGIFRMFTPSSCALTFLIRRAQSFRVTRRLEKIVRLNTNFYMIIYPFITG